MSTPTAETLALIGNGDTRRYDNGTVSSPAGRVVARWHDDVHQGPFAVCDQQPCHAVRNVDTDGGDDW